MPMFQANLMGIIERDTRYAYEAYEFLFQALHFTQKLLGREPPEPGSPEGREIPEESPYHVSGPELMHGARELALREFGFMARVVFKLWGVRATDDFGEMVFNLIEAGLMSKTSEDSRADFHAVYDLDEALRDAFRFEFDEDTVA
jgi:uncharacterized repeat protein (TIGR04138 family)